MKKFTVYITTFIGLSLIVVLSFDSFVMPAYVRMNSGRYMVNVIDKKIEYANKVLKSEGYRSLISDTLFTASFEPGIVVDQYPAPNTRVKEGRTVRLKIAQPEKMVPVATIVNAHPGSRLSCIKKSTGVVVFLWFSMISLFFS